MKNAIVTGGTKGIGLGIAKALLREAILFILPTPATKPQHNKQIPNYLP